MRTFAICLLALLLPAAACAQSARPLNDTGILFCGTGSSPYENNACPSGPASQDALYGRDAAAQAGLLPAKVGGSTLNGGQTNGFDYTKIANNGNELDANVPLGPNPTDWACTRDNVTGLIWEVKTDDNGLRDKDHTYVNNTNTGATIPGLPTCSNTLTACNTESYVAAVNDAALCGHNDWRMPTVKELESIVDFGRHNPAIDQGYFPNTLSSLVWSGSPHAYYSSSAWLVGFYFGNANGVDRDGNRGVRLVRAGQ